MRPDSQTRATLVLTPSLIGFKKARLAAPVRVPILGVAYYEIQNVLAARKLDHGGVTHSGAQADDLIRVVAYPNHGRLRRRRFLRGGGAWLRPLLPTCPEL